MTVSPFGDITPTVGIVSLTDLKAHLRFPDPAAPTPDDDALEGFIYAATEVIECEVGRVVQRPVTEYHDGGRQVIYLKQTPVLSVTTIIENWGYYNWNLVLQPPTTVPAANLFAYSLDNPGEGRVTRRTVGNVSIPFMSMGSEFPANIKVVYLAGRNQTPWAVRLATLELCAHWWQNSQQRQYGAAGVSSNFDSSAGIGTPSTFFGVPYRILELIKSHRRTPILG